MCGYGDWKTLLPPDIKQFYFLNKCFLAIYVTIPTHIKRDGNTSPLLIIPQIRTVSENVRAESILRNSLPVVLNVAPHLGRRWEMRGCFWVWWLRGRVGRWRVCLQRGRRRFGPWEDWEDSLERERQPAPVILLGNSHGQSSPAWWANVHRVTKSWTRLSD